MQGGRTKTGGWTGNLTAAANYVVKIVGAAIFAVLLWYAFRYTWYVLPGGREMPVDMHDSMWKNLLCVICVMVFVAALLYADRKVPAKGKKIIEGVSVLCAMLWVGGAGFWWINAAVHVPNGDCAFIYGGASYFLEKQFSFLEPPGGYCAMHPYQLGLIAPTELLFLVVGTYNFHAFQTMCVLFSVGIVLAGFLILRELVESMAAVVFYSAMISACLPLIFYTTWVYGDLPSIFFIAMAVWMLLRYVKDGRIGWLPGMIFMVTMAMLARRPVMVFIVALCLVIVVAQFKKPDWKLLCAAALCVLVPWLAYEGIYKMYEVRSGYEHYPGIPTITWIDMGLHDVDGVCGWYDNWVRELYYSTDCDVEQTKALAKLNIQDRWKEIWENPSYARDFFRKKILSQWNTPMYQALYFNTMYDEEDVPAEDSTVSKIGNEYFFDLLTFCDRLQVIVYLGFLCYCIWGIKKDGNILLQITAVTVIGGFFLSVIWEAKARYIFPYYVMMFPYAAAGYCQMLQAVKRLCGQNSLFCRILHRSR